MAPSKIFTVFGATGNQGGSVIAAVLSDPELSAEYQLRGITRDPSKPNAQKLSAQGVEMVSADMNDPVSLESAIAGSHTLFAVTNYWDTLSKDREVEQGRNIVDASIAAGVKHLIYASLPHAIKMSGGRLKHLDHFDSKGEVEEYIESIKGANNMVASYWMAGFFMSNFKGMITRDPQTGTMITPDPRTGTPTLKMPWDATATRVGLLDVVSDTGKFVAGLLRVDPQSVDGFHLNGVSQWATPEEIVHTLSEAGGTAVDFQEVSAEEYGSYLPELIAREMVENMLLIRDWDYFWKGAEKHQAKSHRFLGDAKLTSWEQYVRQNGPWELPEWE